MHIHRTQSRSNKYLVSFGFLASVLIFAFSLWGCSANGAEPSSAPAKPTESNSDGQVVITYFHTTFRCPTCKKLESYSRETVENDFAKQIKENKIVFRTVNLEEAENEHFIKDYKLYTKSLIVSLQENGKEIRWKNLPDIWRLVHSREKFEEYVQSEIEAYLKDL